LLAALTKSSSISVKSTTLVYASSKRVIFDPQYLEDTVLDDPQRHGVLLVGEELLASARAALRSSGSSR
jgi:hypothetical protein